MDFRVLFRSLKELHLLFFHWLPVINSHKCCSSSQTCSYFIAPCLPQRFACMLFVKLGTVQSMARLLSLWWELSSNPAPPQGTSVSSGTKPRWKWSVHGCEKIKIIQKKNGCDICTCILRLQAAADRLQLISDSDRQFISFLFFEWSRCTYLSLLRYFKDSLSCHSSSSLYTFMPQQVTVASLHTDMFTNSLEHLTVDHHLSFQSFASSPGVAIRCLELINPPLHWLQPTLRLQHFKQTEFKKRKPVKQDWIRETDKVRVAVKVI